MSSTGSNRVQKTPTSTDTTVRRKFNHQNLFRRFPHNTWSLCRPRIRDSRRRCRRPGRRRQLQGDCRAASTTCMTFPPMSYLGHLGHLSLDPKCLYQRVWKLIQSNFVICSILIPENVSCWKNRNKLPFPVIKLLNISNLAEFHV